MLSFQDREMAAAATFPKAITMVLGLKEAQVRVVDSKILERPARGWEKHTQAG